MRVTRSVPAHSVASVSEGGLLPVPLQFAAGISVSEEGSFVVGASCESHNPGPVSPAKPDSGGSELHQGLGDRPTGHGFLSLSLRYS